MGLDFTPLQLLLTRNESIFTTRRNRPEHQNTSLSRLDSIPVSITDSGHGVPSLLSLHRTHAASPRRTNVSEIRGDDWNQNLLLDYLQQLL